MCGQEVGRLLPQLGPGGTGPGGQGGGWRRERLFSAVAELLGAVAGGRRPVCVVVEDVHWADSATLDCLTFLARAAVRAAVTLVVTCRSDEAPLDAQVAGWLAHVRGGGGVEEIRLAPLSREEVAEQVAGLAGGPPPPPVAEELYARAEGNPFFTEQLVAAMLAGAAGSGCWPAARLAELLAARAGRCGGDGRAVLAALAVAGRPLAEDQLAGVTGLAVEAVRRGLRELATARLLADDTQTGRTGPGMRCWPRRWPPGCCPASEWCCTSGQRGCWRRRAVMRWPRRRPATGRPRAAAPRSCPPGWRRPGPPSGCSATPRRRRTGSGPSSCARHCPPRAAGADLPRLYVRAIDALVLSGDSRHAGVLAEEAYRRFASHPDPATAAVICQRAGYLRGLHAPAAGLPADGKRRCGCSSRPRRQPNTPRPGSTTPSFPAVPATGAGPTAYCPDPGAGDRRSGAAPPP